MKKSFMVINVSQEYSDDVSVRLKCTDRFTGDEILSAKVIGTREIEGYLVHETENEFLIEERRYAKSTN